VEAAACGTPVIATRQSPLPQLLAGGGIFVEPGDVAALTVAMQAILGDPASSAAMGAEGLRQARRLTWARAADHALGALREAAA
jgi:glycosyltransferase involved in cell wall biosynthesis